MFKIFLIFFYAIRPYVFFPEFGLFSRNRTDKSAFFVAVEESKEITLKFLAPELSVFNAQRNDACKFLKNALIDSEKDRAECSVNY